MKESRLWFWHMMAGVILILLLGLHTLIMHFDTVLAFFGFIPKSAWTTAGPSGALNFQESVLPRMQSIFMTAVYVLLAIFGLFHGLYGVRSIIWELKIPLGVKKAAGVLVVLAGLALAAYGVVTVLQGHLRADSLMTAPR